jgi:hypothetical protein
MSYKIISLALMMLMACGCATQFKEIHYFKSDTSSSAIIPNYYRLTIDGYAFFCSSRYISGYFDEDTINTYFNEYTQPAGAMILPRSSPGETKTADEKQKTTSIEPVAKELQGKQLIMILSSNSDEISTQIGALAASNQFTASLAGLIARDQYTAADAAESRSAIEKSRAKVTSSLAKQIVSVLPDNASDTDANGTFLRFINALAFDLGYNGIFDNLDDANKWLQVNRAQLLRRDR